MTLKRFFSRLRKVEVQAKQVAQIQPELVNEIRLTARQDAVKDKRSAFAREDYQLIYDVERAWFDKLLRFAERYAQDKGTFVRQFTSQ